MVAILALLAFLLVVAIAIPVTVWLLAGISADFEAEDDPLPSHDVHGDR